MFLFSFQKDGKHVKYTIASSLRDPELVSELKELRDFYSKQIKAFEVGRYVLGANRVALYENLTLATKQELKSIPQAMLKSLYEQDFSNDNTTFFMLERGLVTANRNALSDKGKDILDAFIKDDFLTKTSSTV